MQAATTSDGSATRPVITMSAPPASASTIGAAPRYALAVTSRSRTSLIAAPVSRLRNSGEDESAAAARTTLQNIVARDDADPQRAAPGLRERCAAGLGTAARVQPAGIRDQPASSARRPVRRERPDHVDKVAGKSGLRIALALHREDRHRHLGQIIEREVIEVRLAREHLRRRIGAIAPKRLSVSDSNGFRHRHHLTPATRPFGSCRRRSPATGRARFAARAAFRAGG